MFALMTAFGLMMYDYFVKKQSIRNNEMSVRLLMLLI